MNNGIYPASKRSRNITSVNDDCVNSWNWDRRFVHFDQQVAPRYAVLVDQTLNVATNTQQILLEGIKPAMFCMLEAVERTVNEKSVAEHTTCFQKQAPPDQQQCSHGVS